MRIALYGTDLRKLRMHKQRLQENFAKIDNEVEISCYEDKGLLKNNLEDFQVIFMEETSLQKFEMYAESEKSRKKIAFAIGKEIVTYYIKDIYYVEAELSKIHLATKDGEYILPITITEAEKILEADGFIKTHRSYLINMAHISKLKSRIAVLDNGKEMPISKYRSKQVREKYLKMMEEEEKGED